MKNYFTIQNYAKRFVTLGMILLTISVGNAWGAMYFHDEFHNVGSNSSSYTSRTGWTLSNTYAHYNSAIRLGTSGGYATKSAITSIAGTKNLSVTVYVAKWNTDASSLVVTVGTAGNIEGNSSKTFSDLKKSTSTGGAVSWDDTYKISFVVTGATSSTTITFGTNASGNRIMLGPVKISDADEDCRIFYESFDRCAKSGGNDGTWSGISGSTSSISADNSGWSFGSYGYAASSCARFGTGSYKGSAETPTIAYSGTNDLILSFKAGAWNGASEGTTLNLTATNATLGKSSVTLSKGEWTTYTVSVTPTKTNFKIKWEAKNASNNRFFLDEVCITEDASCSSLDPLNGTISSSTSSSVVLEWDKIEGVDYDNDLGYGPFIVDVTPSAGTTVGDIDLTGSKATCEVTGLTPCTEYTFTILGNKDNSGDYCEDIDEDIVFTPGYTYTINTTHVSTSDAIPDTQCDGDISATFEADDGYSLPSSITVSGASAYTWEDGVLEIDADDVTGNVSVTITGVQYTASFSTGIGNPSVSSRIGGEVEFPDGVTPTADNWEFVGWATSKCDWQMKAPHLYVPGDTYVLESDITFYAVYRKYTGGTATATFTASGSDFEEHEYYARCWVDKSAGVDMFINKGSYTASTRWNVAADDSDTEDYFVWINAHRKISTIVFTSISSHLLYDGGVWNDYDDAYNGSNASIATDGTTQTVTCTTSGNVAVTGVITYSDDDIEAQFSAVSVTYYKAAFASEPICDGYTFHTGNNGDPANLWTITPFVEGTSHAWNIANYTIPSTTHFYVGRDGYFMNGSGGNILGSSSRSATKDWNDAPYHGSVWEGGIFLQPNNLTLNSFAVGRAAGATGTITIIDNSSDYNLYASFTPDGYGITYSGSGKAFAKTATANTWETDVVTLPAVSTTYNIGLKTATAGTYVKCAHSKSTDEAISAIGVTELSNGKKKILFQANQYANEDAKIALYNVTGSSWVGFMTDEDEDGVYEAEVPTTCATVIFSRHGNVATPAFDNAYNHSVDISLPTDGMRVVYAFDNNWDNKDGSGYHKGFTPTNVHPATGDVGKFRMWDNSTAQNWYVHFVPHFKLTYNANGGSSTTNPTYRNSESSTLTVSTATSTFTPPTGHHFDHWDTKADGSGDDYDEGDSYTLTSDAVLHAIWAPNEHTLTWNLSGGTVTTAGTAAAKDATGSPSGTVAYGTGITAPVVAKEGHTWNNWNTTPASTMPDDDLTYTAQWTVNSYTLTWNLAGGTVTTAGTAAAKDATGSPSGSVNYGTTVTAPVVAKTGYTFSAWSPTVVSPMPASAKTYTATWSINSYALSWDWNGGSTSATAGDDYTAEGDVVYNTTLSYPEDGTMSKTGHTFTGWSPSPTNMPAEATEIVAQWSVNSYKVTMDDVDDVTITATPAVGDAISNDEYAEWDYGSTVTLSYSGITSGMYWAGWIITDEDGTDVTDDVLSSSTLTIPDYDITITALLYKNLKAWCMPEFEVTGDIHLTSIKGVYVNSTSTTGDLLTVSGTNTENVTRISIDYLDNNGDVVGTKSTSPLRLRAGDNSGYAETDITTGFSTGTYSGSFSVRFTPTAYDELDNYKLRLTIKKGSRVLKTIEHPMNGRALPEEFVIAVKQNNQWYALPNTILDNTKAITPLKITVNNATTPTAATYAPTTAVYKGYETSNSRYAAETNIYGVRLIDPDDHWLQVSNSSGTNYVWVSGSGSSTCQDWWLSSSDFRSYTLKVPSSGAGDKSFGINNLGNIGFHPSNASNLCKEVYLLPITNKYTDFPATVTEWGQSSVILAVNAASADHATAQIETGDATSNQTITPINETKAKAKNFKVTLGDIDLDVAEGNEGKLLYINWLDGGGVQLGRSCVTIPRIVAEDRTANKTNDTDKKVWNTEVHVLPGATLTIDGNTFVTGVINSTVSVKELHVYPGATLNVSTGTLTATTLRLHNGWTRAGDKQYNTARVYIADDAALTKTTASMDYDIYEQSDGKHYYPLAVPFETAVSSIDYADSYLAGFSTYGTHYAIKTYNGERRAEYGEDQANNWSIVASDATLSPGKGYIMTAVAVKGEAIIRIPLVYNDAWTADGELGTATYDAASHTKNVVAVTAYTGSAASSNDRHKGWNMLGVPYMSCFATKDGATHSKDEGFITGKMVLTGDPSDPFGGYDDGVVYVTVPTHDFSEYIQSDITDGDTKLLPGWCFLIQAAKDGNVTFLDSKRTQDSDLPIYAPKQTAEEEAVLRTGIVLSDAEKSDKTTILVSNKYSSDYEIGADLEKMFGTGYTLAVYSLLNNTRLAYNAMSPYDAREVIPIGYRAPTDGEYTFSLNPRYADAPFERVDLIDYQLGTVTDLMNTSYTFSTSRTQDDTRFALNIVSRKDTPTDIENGAATDDKLAVKKVIINDQMYIILGDKMYDATGKRVKGINK